MNADGSNPRAVFTDLNATALEPAWTPDGNYIVVRKGGRGGGGEGGAPPGGIWMYHKDGGQGVQIVGPPAGGRRRWRWRNGAPRWPTVSGDGRYLYYQVSMTVDDKEPLSGSMQLRRFEFKTGETVDSPPASATAQRRPVLQRRRRGAEISPDGRWLAFARQIPDGSLEYKGTSTGRARRSGCAT